MAKLSGTGLRVNHLLDVHIGDLNLGDVVGQR